MEIAYRLAIVADIPEVLKPHPRYQINPISEAEQGQFSDIDGFSQGS